MSEHTELAVARHFHRAFTVQTGSASREHHDLVARDYTWITAAQILLHKLLIQNEIYSFYRVLIYRVTEKLGEALAFPAALLGTACLVGTLILQPPSHPQFFGQHFFSNAGNISLRFW